MNPNFLNHFNIQVTKVSFQQQFPSNLSNLKVIHGKLLNSIRKSNFIKLTYNRITIIIERISELEYTVNIDVTE